MASKRKSCQNRPKGILCTSRPQRICPCGVVGETVVVTRGRTAEKEGYFHSIFFLIQCISIQFVVILMHLLHLLWIGSIWWNLMCCRCFLVLACLLARSLVSTVNRQIDSLRIVLYWHCLFGLVVFGSRLF